tara:strand:- start:76 stop:438 length:363 start_codon:yes stop_codon:yes gene_type:complete
MKYPEKIELALRPSKNSFIVSEDLSTNRLDGEYDIYFYESDFSLPEEVIAEKMDKGDFQAEYFKSQITIKDGVIDKDSLMFAVRELLEDCGWFNAYPIAFVTALHDEGDMGYIVNINETN